MPSTVLQFSTELKMPPAALLEQLNRAGVSKRGIDDSLTDKDKSRLLEYLRHAHAKGEDKIRITLRRKTQVPASVITKSDGLGLGLTEDQIAFLKRMGVPLDKVFDAKGMGPSVYGPKMRALNKVVAYNTSICKRRHKLGLQLN